MIPLQITIDVDKTPWTDIRSKLEPGMGKITRVGRLTRGCQSGKSAVAIVIETEDGRQFVAETTMALFLTAARALKAVEDEMNGENAKN